MVTVTNDTGTFPFTMSVQMTEVIPTGITALIRYPRRINC